METASTRVGKRGTVVLPARLRRKYRIEEGSTVTVEEREGGILIRPAVTLPVEIYSAERKAEFLLSNAVDEASYAAARDEVRRLGLDPEAVAHRRPGEA